MNIIEYRAMVAEETAAAAQPETATTATTQEVIPNQTQTMPVTVTPAATTATVETTTTAPTTVKVEGIGDVPIEELTKGYLRQSDYTRKTQELARARQQSAVAQSVYESISSNPEIVQDLATKGVAIPDAAQVQILDLSNRYNDLLLEREIEQLTTKYTDFNAQEVLKFAYDNKYENLDDAYQLLKSRSATPGQAIDMAALTEQIRQQVVKDLQLNVDTNTIIQSGGESQQLSGVLPSLTPQELKVAKSLRMEPEVYIKWRDKK
jgi:hypothetical protein